MLTRHLIVRRVTVLLAALLITAVGFAADTAVSLSRLRDDIMYLASDELEGRGVGTRGLELAAEYIAREFTKAGLRTDQVAGTPFQSFAMNVRSELGQTNELVLHSQDGRQIALQLGTDFMPLAMGGAGEFSAPLVFAGYGIEATQEGYNDYEKIDVKDKVVLLMRREPQQDNPHSAFNGNSDSRYAALQRKLSTAYQRGAKAVLFVTDPYTLRRERQSRLDSMVKRLDEAAVRVVADGDELLASEQKDPQALQKHREKLRESLGALRSAREALHADHDKLLDFNYGGSDGESSIPFIHLTRRRADEVLRSALGIELEKLEAIIDNGPQPQSKALEGWRVEGRVSIDRTQQDVKNVIAVLEGKGPKANETIVVGAHYDHLGHGGDGSLAPGSTEIHNGADDNASGTAAVLELARRLAARPEPLPRRVVFIAFTAEEKGLIGSSAYVRKPLVPMSDTIAMINLDMVGRLVENKLAVFGTGTAKEFEEMVPRLAKGHNFELAMHPEGEGPSDHTSFYLQKVPVLHVFTGNHPDYHKPSDDADKINLEGARRVVDMVEEAVVELAQAEGRPQYVAVASPPRGEGDRPYFGSIPDFGRNVEGYAIQGVGPGSPAEKAGLQQGDVIIRLGDKKIGNLNDFDLALRAHKSGQTVSVVVQRDGKEVTLEVTLAARK
ncbi:MAG: M20/M25/M40 family metallo-hydrolase [Planctomycetes bacterium]|nr:M20/M25/M40 family metallo-hydrolase [Planctomycetota bacterium]